MQILTNHRTVSANNSRITGEYETFTLDCPLFRRKLVISSSEIITHSDDAFAPVHLLNVEKCEMQSKDEKFQSLSQKEILQSIIDEEGETLFEKLNPLNYCSPFNSVSDAHMEEEPDITTLDFHQTKEELKLREDGFFEVTTLGTSADDAECVREAFSSLETLLSSHNYALSDVAKIVMYIDSMESYAEMNRQYSSYFGLNPPVRVCVGVDKTVMPGQSRLILVTSGLKRQDRRYLHVQGISHWAPANIGNKWTNEGTDGHVALYIYDITDVTMY